MNCEKCQELVSDLLDGAITKEDELTLNSHLHECLPCTDVRNELEAIVTFCRSHRGEFVAPPNEMGLWLRIRNTIEAENAASVVAAGTSQPKRKSLWADLMGRSWELSFAQLAASVSAIAVIVALTTVVGLRRWQSSDAVPTPTSSAVLDLNASKASVSDRMWQQQQSISYWNQRVELNKARWSPQMRETFDRNLRVIDQAVNDSMNDLSRNPHDEVSEEMLNAALNEKLSLLKEFADL